MLAPSAQRANSRRLKMFAKIFYKMTISLTAARLRPWEKKWDGNASSRRLQILLIACLKFLHGKRGRRKKINFRLQQTFLLDRVPKAG
jgi:hypothetical protein